MTAPALIVGAGPAGLTTAIALARAGVRCVLVERRAELSSLPRATSVSVRTMEILRTWGLEDEVRSGGPEVEWQMWECETLADAAAGSAIDAGIPSRAASALVSPTVAACVPQDHVEAVLLRHLRSLPAATVELGTEVIALAANADGVDVTLRRAGGERADHAGRVRGRRRRRARCHPGPPGDRRVGQRAAPAGRHGALPRTAVGAARRPPVRPLHAHSPRRPRHLSCPPGSRTAGSTGRCRPKAARPTT